MLNRLSQNNLNGRDKAKNDTSSTPLYACFHESTITNRMVIYYLCLRFLKSLPKTKIVSLLLQDLVTA